MNDRQRRQSRRWLIIVGTIAAIAVGLLTWQAMVGMNSMNDVRRWPAKFQSNGERIYFTGTSASGLDISARGGNMHMNMMGGGCVTCHGVERQGARLMPQFWKSAPALTSEALFGEHGEDGHGDHDAYSNETLVRAITQGVDAAGQPLGQEMPRWSMSEQDINDLVSFLKTSQASSSP